MILRSVTLDNIRSYREPTRIDFQLGTTLFEGDVASGKSTILSAVEFALFGLGDLNGSFLLRNGSDAGKVVLEFEVDGKSYEVHRSLVRKGESVRSGESFIAEEGEKRKLATKELKERILQLLKFNEPSNPKSQSVIYRYAIFTPQEAMREVIEKDPGARLETLRKAYGIEQYRTAAQNTKSITTEFRVKISGLKGRVGDLDHDRKELAALRARVRELTVRLEEVRNKKEALGRDLEARRKELHSLEQRRMEIGKAQEMIPLLQRQLDEKEREKRSALREVESAERRIGTISKSIAGYESVESPTSRSMEELEVESRRLEREARECRDQRSKFSERLENFNEILEKGICPICEREYEADRVGERKTHIESELAKMNHRVLKLEREEKEVGQTIAGLNEYHQAQKDLRLLRENLADTKGTMEEGAKRVRSLEAGISELNEQVRHANRAGEPLRNVLAEIKKAEDGIQGAEERHSSAVRQLGATEKEMEKSREDEEKLSTEIKRREGLLRLLSALEEDRMWLGDYFAPTVEMIEEQSFANRNQRFNQQFQRWFQVLVDDPDLAVRVKEDFSPVIEREGYEQDYRQLSGGERTSVALAYRLALNTTVQEAAVGQEPNLLILDEPTDGFSKEQLAKFGDILTELKCPQVILVSHEQELENLADQVYKIEKVNGESKISVV